MEYYFIKEVSSDLDQEADLIRKHSDDEARCADRPQHLNLLQAANKREFEVLLFFLKLYRI
jgi:hypothetical protein